MKLVPLPKNVIFQFLDDTRSSDGKFMERARGIIVLAPTCNSDRQNGIPRWGKVVAVGDGVDEVDIGDFILIEAGRWTLRCEFEGENYWKTDIDSVIGCSTDIRVTYDF